MKTNFHSIGAAVALLSMSAVAFAAVAGLSVKRQPKEGQIVKLRLKASLEIQGVTALFTGLIEDKVTKVDTDGAYTEEERQTEGKAKFNDMETPSPDVGPFPITHNADGSLREIKGDETTAGPDAYRMSNLDVIIDPGKPLNVGDTWTADIKEDAKKGSKPGKAEYKVLGEEKIGEVDTVKISAKVKENGPATGAGLDGTYWLSKVDGTIIKAEVKWVNAPFPGAQAPMNATITETREF